MNIFVVGSKLDRNMWQYYTSNLDLSQLKQQGGGHGYCMYVSKLYQEMAINLQTFHDCKINYVKDAGARRGILKSRKLFESDRKHPSSRLEDLVLSREGLEYAVFCSYHKCGKRAERDHFAGKCGSCRLTRYCSKQCQIDHWTQGDHKINCYKVVPLEFK